MFWWESLLFQIRLRVCILLHIVKSDPLSPKAERCRKHLVGDSQGSDTLSHTFIPRMNGVMSKCNTIASLTFPEGISLSQIIDSLTSYGLAFQANMSTSLDQWTCGSRESWFLCHRICQANGVTVPIQQHNIPNTVVVHKARCVEKWCGQGNRFDNIIIQGDRTPRISSWLRQQGYYPASLLYVFCCSYRINWGEANDGGGVLWWTVHHDLLFVEDLEYQLSVMPNRHLGMIICHDVPQRVQRIVVDSSVLTPLQQAPSSEDTQYLLNHCATLKLYNIKY